MNDAMAFVGYLVCTVAGFVAFLYVLQKIAFAVCWIQDISAKVEIHDQILRKKK